MKQKLWIETEPLNKYSESIRSLRESLYARLSGQKNPVIVVSSPHRQDGCSTLTANLAASIAQSGKRVLLIDGDLTGNGLENLFQVDSKDGFIQILDGGGGKIVPSGLKNLDFLPTGAPKANSHPFDSPRLKEFLNKFQNDYDFVLIDTAPVLESSDIIILGQNSAGVILVFKAGNFQREDEITSREMLERSGVKIIGAVVNGIKEKDQDPYYTYQRFLGRNR
ncbi:CpsD/CapB family tyrosine-protein kinase [bacterium]|nr:CpsD/CapB family tyrosine-protein kinase [bacterium]MBU1025623.1 CpsD/CapB family tyrosine-protein kinase [bacterium]